MHPSHLRVPTLTFDELQVSSYRMNTGVGGPRTTHRVAPQETGEKQ